MKEKYLSIVLGGIKLNFKRLFRKKSQNREFDVYIENKNLDEGNNKIQKGESFNSNQKSDATTLHFHYLKLIDIYVKEQKEDEIIKICKKDINLYPKFQEEQIIKDKNRLQEMIKIYKKLGKSTDKFETELASYIFHPPNVPSFSRLIGIYEKNNNLQETIDIYKKAISFNLAGYKESLAMLYFKLPEPLKKVVDNEFDINHELTQLNNELNKIKIFVFENPGINKSNLLSGLVKQFHWYQHKAQSYIDLALLSKIIFQEKQGRFYKHYTTKE